MVKAGSIHHTIEYVPKGEDINNWHELITSQYIPAQNVTVQQFYQQFLKQLQQEQIQYTSHIITEKKDLLLFEFQVSEPSNLQQDELQKK